MMSFQPARDMQINTSTNSMPLAISEEHWLMTEMPCRKLQTTLRIASKMTRMLVSGLEIILPCFSSTLTIIQSIVPMINSLKLSYCLNISGAEDSSSKDKVEAFVSKCMKLYQSCAGNGSPEKTKEEKESASATESQPRDDLCILAAMALLRASETGETQVRVPNSALIRAAGILERLLLDSPHNYQARLLLVRIYLLLGAGSLAMSTFSKLSVKQIQYETVAHNLFTRLATIHPHSAPPVEGAEYKDFDPQAAFVQGLNFYRNSEVSTLKFRTRCMSEGSFVNAEEMVQLRERLRNSICRRMMALEVRRSQRLAGGDPMTRYDDIGLFIPILDANVAI